MKPDSNLFKLWEEIKVFFYKAPISIESIFTNIVDMSDKVYMYHEDAKAKLF